jgi:hypothetical protein
MGLDSVELVVSWEKAFAISIPDEIAAKLVTPDAAVTAISGLLADDGRAMTVPEIEEIIKMTTLRVTGVGESGYRGDGRFVEDFGLD